MDAVFGTFMEILLATALLEGVCLLYDQELHFKKICYCSVKAWKSQGSWSPRLVTEALKYQLISCTNKNVVNALVGVEIPKTLIMEETLLQILVVVMMKM